MDNVNILQVILSFGLVIGLIGLFAVALKYFSQKYPRWITPQTSGRLQVMETKMLDARRRLVLIKRDEQEHLLLLSPQGDTCIETVKKNV